MKKLLSSSNLTIILSFISLSACVATPQTTPVSIGNEQSLSCQQLEAEIARAEQLMIEARKDDRFRTSYLFPPSAIASSININKAENSAKQRVEYLQNISHQKSCNYRQRNQFNGYNTQQSPSNPFATQQGFNQNMPPQYLPQNLPQKPGQTPPLPDYSQLVKPDVAPTDLSNSNSGNPQYQQPQYRPQPSPQPNYNGQQFYVPPTDPVTQEELDEPVGQMPNFDPKNYDYRYRPAPKNNPDYDQSIEQQLDKYGPSDNGMGW